MAPAATRRSATTARRSSVVRGALPGGARDAARSRSCSTSMRPTTRCTAIRTGGSSTAITTATVICRCTSSAASTCWRPSCGRRTLTARPGRQEKSARIVGRIRRALAAGTHRTARRLRASAASRSWPGARRTASTMCSAWPATRRLCRSIDVELAGDAAESMRPPGRPARIFSDFEYRTKDSWSRARRVVAKAEHLDKGPNPRFIVTSLRPNASTRDLYEEVYCARGEMENRIKEQQLYLFADRGQRPPCAPINCACGSPRWPTCC